jgi:hypothetical protein
MLCAVNFFQSGGDVTQGRLKFLRHVVQRAVGINHGIFEQAVGIDFGTGSGDIVCMISSFGVVGIFMCAVSGGKLQTDAALAASFRFKANPL